MIVLDAAALVDLVALRPAAEWVLDQLPGRQVAAPAHQLAEVVSALARLDRAGELGPAPQQAVADAVALPQHVHELDVHLLRRALDLRERVRVVDGLYVALAERLDVPVVTTDARLARAEPPCEIRTPPAGPSRT